MISSPFSTTTCRESTAQPPLLVLPGLKPCPLHQEARPHLSVPGRDVLVRATVLIVGVGAMGADTVDVAGYDEEKICFRPQGPGLQDGWLWTFPSHVDRNIRRFITSPGRKRMRDRSQNCRRPRYGRQGRPPAKGGKPNFQRQKWQRSLCQTTEKLR